jgi:hypothetical protein
MNTKNTAPDLDDEDADLATADRGNDFAGDGDDDDDDDDKGTDDAKADTDKGARDAKGRFTKPGDKVNGSEKHEDDEEHEEEDEDEKQGTVNEDEDEGDKQNAFLRLNKMKAQRDTERAEKSRLAAEKAALEAELAKLKAKPESEVDPIAEINATLDGLYEKVEEARADGNVKEAARLQREIDKANREIAKKEAEQVASTTTTQAQLNARYDAMLDVCEASIDLINPSHDDFDQKAVASLNWHVDAFEKAGLDGPAALRRATVLLFGFDPTKPKRRRPTSRRRSKPTRSSRRTPAASASTRTRPSSRRAR